MRHVFGLVCVHDRRNVEGSCYETSETCATYHVKHGTHIALELDFEFKQEHEGQICSDSSAINTQDVAFFITSNDWLTGDLVTNILVPMIH